MKKESPQFVQEKSNSVPNLDLDPVVVMTKWKSYKESNKNLSKFQFSEYNNIKIKW